MDIALTRIAHHSCTNPASYPQIPPGPHQTLHRGPSSGLPPRPPPRRFLHLGLPPRPLPRRGCRRLLLPPHLPQEVPPPSPHLREVHRPHHQESPMYSHLTHSRCHPLHHQQARLPQVLHQLHLVFGVLRHPRLPHRVHSRYTHHSPRTQPRRLRFRIHWHPPPTLHHPGHVQPIVLANWHGKFQVLQKRCSHPVCSMASLHDWLPHPCCSLPPLALGPWCWTPAQLGPLRVFPCPPPGPPPSPPCPPHSCSSDQSHLHLRCRVAPHSPLSDQSPPASACLAHQASEKRSPQSWGLLLLVEAAPARAGVLVAP
mmetsp:Transcript_43474/g.102433  ORF Transcript_43474/g.102433 Transcript_43474/m.102433 type:complete len:313 (+) Transcript_43474:962-1900(+)